MNRDAFARNGGIEVWNGALIGCNAIQWCVAICNYRGHKSSALQGCKRRGEGKYEERKEKGKPGSDEFVGDCGGRRPTPVATPTFCFW